MADGDSPDECSYEASWISEALKDIKPVPQDDGPDPVVAIAYSDKFRVVYDYFRAVLLRNEMSERALALTVDALELNPANYTVWQYRRTLLKHLKKDLNAELEYAREMIEENPKNYQVWHHRRVICEWLGCGIAELALTADSLADDPKNYHAWQHRQWAIRTFGLVSGELAFVDRLLEADVRNNSAWNQRYFLLTLQSEAGAPSAEMLDREADFALAAIARAPRNESAWSFLRGVLALADSEAAQLRALAACAELLLADPGSPHALAFMVDSQSQSSPERAAQLCVELAEKHDTIRAPYWRYMARSIVGKAANRE